MLSILLPVYNWNVTQLVGDLHRQCLAADIRFEIRCYEDGSAADEQQKNESLCQVEKVVYRVYRENQGRARIRNILARDALFSNLLFLDGDSGLPDHQFVQRYVDALAENTVLYGGRIYPPARPARKACQLHWRYGHRRETSTAAERRVAPYERFMTNNFLIPKEVLLRIGFEERLLQYGHEDTLFGQQLSAQAIPIVHLDNPVVHLGLEPAEVFLEKNRQAVQNLHFLDRQYPELETHLLVLVRRLKKRRIDGMVWIALRSLLPLLRQNLLSERPRLRALDLFKLYYFLYYDRK